MSVTGSDLICSGGWGSFEMERKYRWKLKRIEELPETKNQVFEVDCVFEGKTEFPKSYYDTEKGEG
jgi:hypothetical protein